MPPFGEENPRRTSAACPPLAAPQNHTQPPGEHPSVGPARPPLQAGESRGPDASPGPRRGEGFALADASTDGRTDGTAPRRSHGERDFPRPPSHNYRLFLRRHLPRGNLLPRPPRLREERPRAVAPYSPPPPPRVGPPNGRQVLAQAQARAADRGGVAEAAARCWRAAGEGGRRRGSGASDRRASGGCVNAGAVAKW